MPGDFRHSCIYFHDSGTLIVDSDTLIYYKPTSCSIVTRHAGCWIGQFLSTGEQDFSTFSKQ